MANNDNLLTKAFGLTRNVATGHHILSRLVAPLLLIADVGLCLAIIKKVPCKSHPISPQLK